MPGPSDVSATDVVPVAVDPESGRPNRAGSGSPAQKSKRSSNVARLPRPIGGGRTTRVVVRRLDPWSVLKLSLVYYAALFVVLLVAAVLLWAGAAAVGVIGNIESFMEDIGFEDFRFLPGELLRGTALGGLVLVVAGTCTNVLLATLFNLMTDVVGGLKLTLQEDVERNDGKATV